MADYYVTSTGKTVPFPRETEDNPDAKAAFLAEIEGAPAPAPKPKKEK